VFFPETPQTIGQRPFYSAASLDTIVIPQSVTVIEADVFLWSSLTVINVRAASILVGWGSDWNWTSIPVVLDYTD